MVGRVCSHPVRRRVPLEDVDRVSVRRYRVSGQAVRRRRRRSRRRRSRNSHPVNQSSFIGKTEPNLAPPEEQRINVTEGRTERE